jgi:hypothetical protein
LEETIDFLFTLFTSITDPSLYQAYRKICTGRLFAFFTSLTNLSPSEKKAAGFALYLGTAKISGFSRDAATATAADFLKEFYDDFFFEMFVRFGQRQAIVKIHKEKVDRMLIVSNLTSMVGRIGLEGHGVPNAESIESSETIEA